jgi:hypothetical protein
MRFMVTHNKEIWIQDGNEKRKLEGQELLDYEANIALVVAEIEAAKTKMQAEAAAKTALLAKLGITADEAKLLLS